MNNDREIIAAAMRWFAARGRRMGASNYKRDCERNAKQDFVFVNLCAQARASEQLRECKRQERAALRVLAKACEARRDQLGNVDDADVSQILELTLEAQ